MTAPNNPCLATWILLEQGGANYNQQPLVAADAYEKPSRKTPNQGLRHDWLGRVLMLRLEDTTARSPLLANRAEIAGKGTQNPAGRNSLFARAGHFRHQNYGRGQSLAISPRLSSIQRMVK